LLSILDQIDQSLNARSYYLALFVSLAIPDIAGALEAADGQAKPERYKKWYEKWLVHDSRSKSKPSSRSAASATTRKLRIH